PLFVVADPSRLWLNLRARQEDAPLIRPGHKVRFRTAGLDRPVEAEVVGVGVEADEKTRTVRVRAGLANPDGLLRAGAFGSGRVVLRDEPGAVVVPSDSVQWVGDSHLVFVQDRNFDAKDAPKVFHPRVVRPGAKDGNVTEIIAGVLPGEMVVTAG